MRLARRRADDVSVRVFIGDVRAIRARTGSLCVPGMRVWFAHHGLDFDDFVRHGIDAERLEATGDHFAIEVCKAARARTEVAR